MEEYDAVSGEFGYKHFPDESLVRAYRIDTGEFVIEIPVSPEFGKVEQ
jgi:hypothetical protein